MYNESQKIKFIKSYTSSINTANVATVIFNAFEKYETSWQADLCSKEKDVLQPIVDEIAGLRSRSKWMTITILKEYVKWCLVMKVPNACDGMLQVDAIGLDKVRRQMVSSPLHLQRYLDVLFDAESEETIDNIYRCYFWMAYGGIDEGDAILVRSRDVNFNEMAIYYKNTSVPIYRESLSAFRNAVSLTSFLYKHPNYSKPIRRERIEGDILMRGIKAETKILTIRSTLSKQSIQAIKSGKTDMQLSFSRAYLSGLFFRMYERERAGVPIDFSEAAVHAMEGKNYTLSGRAKIEHRQNRIERDYMEDYQRWKLAFSI
ncbi:MAG: hypothetical protein NC548_48740 [Lachnospiraceae bacterium]|nr:hypothetical protein [Lachnospiraceae bacterium]MCM1236351.1 hypothetical protein [Ruminococcus flavefaciens]